MKFAGGNRYHQQMNWGVFNSSPVEQAVPMGGPMLDRSAVGQLSSLSSRTKWQHYVVYRLPAIAAILFYG